MENEKDIKKYWDDAYSGHKTPIKIAKDEIAVENNLDQYIKDYSMHAKKILDYGCGITYNLFLAHFSNPNLELGLGIDPSKNAIDFLRNTSEKSGFKNVSFEVGDFARMQKIKNEDFDFVICMNVLDCITKDIMIKTAGEIVRILKKGGVFLLKVNFYLTPEECKRYHLDPIGDEAYAQKGLFRIAFYKDKYWIKLFTDLGLKLVKSDEYARLENGPKDRIFIFKK